jgi:hypothetical protein
MTRSTTHPKEKSLTRLRVRPALNLAAFAAALIALALALPAVAAAAPPEHALEVKITGNGNVGCKVNAGPLEECELEYPEGTHVTVIAEPEEGSKFVAWNGECDSTNAGECEVTMNADKKIEVVFALEEFKLTLQTEGSGKGKIECEVEGGPAEECKAKYPYGTEIKFVEVPAEGSEFFEWGEDCLGQAEECELTIDEDKVVSAVFELIEVPLETSIEGLGSGEIECEVEGGPAEPCEFEYPYGTKVAFTAVAEPGSEFVEWSEDCSGNGACELTMDEEHFVSAVFGLKVALNIELEGFGEGKVECEVEGGPAEECEAEYLEGTKVKLVPVAKLGSEFIEWTEECSGSGACELTVDEERFVGAVFEPAEEFELEVTVTGNGKVDANTGAISGCRESSGVCSAEYVKNTEVTLTATADSGNQFKGWTGCDSVVGNQCKVTMSAAKSVGAEFEPTPEFTLEVKKGGSGSGTVTSSPPGINCGSECSAEFEEGTKIVLTAVANSGSVFVKWEGCKAEPSPAQCEVTVGEDEEVTAIFELLRTLTITKAGTGSGEVKCKVNGGSAGTCASSYANGTNLELVATAGIGSEFKGFSAGTGSASGCSTLSCAFKIEANSAVTATFNLEPPSEFGLTVALAGTGTGTVTSSPAGINCGIDCSEAYVAGTEVTLTATSASGSSFSGWSGACSGTGACKVTMSQARNATATFTKASPPPPPPPPAPGTAAVGHTAKVKAGKAQLKLTCKGEGPCKGALKLTAKIKSGGKTKTLVIGKASFSLAAGAAKTLKVKLSGPAKTALTKGPLKAKVGGSGVTASTVKLKLA